MSVLVSGNVVCDLLVCPVDRIVWGGTARIERIERRLGGNGANTAYTLGMMGAPVRLAGILGHDDNGAFALEQLRAAGVDTSLVGRCARPTASSVVLVAGNGDRAFLHLFGASADATIEPDFFAVSGCRHYHLASPFGLPLIRGRKAELLHAARAAGLATSLDMHWDAQDEWMADLAPCLPFVDILFANADEARMLTGSAQPDSAAGILLAAGAATVVLKLGGAGSAVYSREATFRAPAYEVEAVDTTGAGDCFAGAFLAALERGGTLEDAACLGNAAGALSVSALGAVCGLRPYEETRAWMARARRRV